MASKPLPSVEELFKLFDFDPDTGVLTWKPRSGGHLGDGSFNARYSGQPAGNDALNGRRQICVKRSVYYAHRIIWKMATGEEPDIIDHIDGNPMNNALANLRSVNKAENGRNQKRYCRNTSGVTGVCPEKRSGLWVSYINIRGKTHVLGKFALFADAVFARKAAEKAVGFHPNHGRAG